MLNIKDGIDKTRIVPGEKLTHEDEGKLTFGTLVYTPAWIKGNKLSIVTYILGYISDYSTGIIKIFPYKNEVIMYDGSVTSEVKWAKLKEYKTKVIYEKSKVQSLGFKRTSNARISHIKRSYN
jgi:hypothetical protein